MLIAKADSFVAMWKDLKLPDGGDRVVRHDHGPHRTIQTGVGPVEVRRAKVRDRGDVGAEEKIRFTSSTLAKWGAADEEAAECMLVLIGARPGGKKELVGSRPECERAPRASVSFSSTSRSVGSRLRRPSRSETARSASGRRSSRFFRAPDTRTVTAKPHYAFNRSF